MQEPNTETFERIDTRIDGYRDRLIDLETLLCSIPALSPDSGGKGELEKCRALEKWLKGAGFTHLERHDAPDARAQEGIRPNLVLTIPGSGSKAGGRLWIMSHLDVVPRESDLCGQETLGLFG
jgi:succinyl-diaminopimelate desuccinylase